MNPLLVPVLWWFDRVVTASWQAAIAAAAVFIVGAVLGRRLSPRWRCALWAIVFLRLALPVLPPNPWRVAPSPLPPPVDPTPRAIGGEVVTLGVLDASSAPPRFDRVEPASSPRDARPALALAWLAGALLLVSRHVVAAARLKRQVRTHPALADARVRDALRECRRQMPVSHVVRAIESPLVSGAAITGVLRPTLLFAPGLADTLSPAELRFVILHELAHLRRQDVLVGWLVALISSLHWFNPIVWLAAARFRADRELACDEAVLRRTPTAPRDAYGMTILKLLAERSTTGLTPAVAVGWIGSRRSVRRRVATIAAGPAPRRWAPLGAIAFLALGCATLTGPRRAAAPTAAVAPPPADDPPATSQPVATSSVENPAEIVTRTNDVRDLLVEIPSFDDAPSSACGGVRSPPVLRRRRNRLRLRPAT
jgi:beta-lactamase regulating signal transducer with metallopeptidase domain